ncbi:SAM and PH domain-containing protein [Sarocladium implicatum]|nr:SAM and PH domain-containing protein [Sarocladium implicatum]
MRQKPAPRDTFFSLRNESQVQTEQRPISVATEFVDTDFDDEDALTDDGNSPRVSLQSSGQPSITTLSSYEEATTPRSSKSRENYGDHWQRPIQGPRGPHLFRSSTDPSFTAPSFTAQSFNEDDVILTLSPVTPKIARGIPDTFVKTQLPRRNSPFQYSSAELDASKLVDWSPEMVAQSMLNAGIELQTSERFIENDINGAILITLKFEDLRELDIPSFGIRTKVWHQIQALRDSRPASPRAPTPIEDRPDRDVRREAKEASGIKRRPSSKRRPRKKPSASDTILPGESVSIIGIEQVIPKPHSCSKGENCSKWKKQQRAIEDFKRLNPGVSIEFGRTVLIAGNAGNPETAEAIDPNQPLRPVSDAEPSVVASSDVLGAGGLPPLQYLREATLRNMKLQDPQDNVRQFLDFQQSSGATSEWPPTPPFEIKPAAQPPHRELRRLPKLNIPNGLPSTPKPNRPSHRRSSTTPTPTKTPPPQFAKPSPEEVFVPYRMTKGDPLSPDLETPRNPYRFGTPFSEMDVPVTAVPLGPVARDFSQSVPPDMSYQTSPSRQNPPRTQSRASARRPSFPVLPALDENKPVRVVPQTPAPVTSSVTTSPPRPPRPAQPLQAPPRTNYPWSTVDRHHWEQGPLSANSEAALEDGVSHEGPMKKRKQRMLRTEWQDGYFTLKGTRLNMHKDSQQRDRTLEYIDIDDYAIACSSLASTSKLSAAFRAVHITSGKPKADAVGAFAFQLIPQDKNGARLRKRDSALPGGVVPAEGVNGTGDEAEG